jgi:tetratricopeptide (TPR) repeat protein
VKTIPKAFTHQPFYQRIGSCERELSRPFGLLIAYVNTPFVQSIALEGSVEEKASKGLLALSLLILIPVLVILFFVIRFIYRHTIGKKLKTTVTEDYQKEAEGFEKAGSFVSAARIYEKKMKDFRKAASLYEKGKDYTQAAMLYDVLGMSGKTKEMYEKAGSLEDAAEVALLEGEFDEAAALYDKAGKKIDVAKIMQQSGKTIYAVKAYREAGEYKKAAMLLKSEGMLREAADMFQIYLYDKQPESSTLDDFYTFALLLENTGNVGKAVEVFQEIERVDPAFKDVQQRIETLIPPEKIPEGKTALRSFLQSGRIEPRYSLKLWVQMLKSLQEAHRNGWPFGLLSPDNIVIDARNNISFLKRNQPSVYSPPETIKEVAFDERADIYSAGVILYEMLTGNLEGLGSTRVIDVVEDVPDWLDEIVIRCIRKVREDRYQSIKDIFTDLKTLSKGAKDSVA